MTEDGERSAVICYGSTMLPLALSAKVLDSMCVCVSVFVCVSVCVCFSVPYKHGHSFEQIWTKFDMWHPYTLATSVRNSQLAGGRRNRPSATGGRVHRQCIMKRTTKIVFNKLDNVPYRYTSILFSVDISLTSVKSR